MQINDGQAEEELQLNLAPMIDVVFLLLVFFMVATTFVEPEKQIDLELPQAESGAEPEELPDELLIQVMRDGQILLGTVEHTRESLRTELERTARARPSTPVTVRGDETVDYGRVVGVLDLCHLVGLTDTSLIVREAVE